MSFKYITKYSSPNYTPANQVLATFGRKRTIEAIAIHWWGDPKQNPKFENIISHLCNKASGVSAHFVATGTGRQVACLVDLPNASWATNSANPYTISIECDPRARAEDYDTVAELIAQLRSIYGGIPLVPHNKFVATACPGAYSLDKLNKIAATKKVSKADDWGKVSNKDTITTKTETKTEAVKFGSVTKDDLTLPKGETKVSIKGEDGVRTIKYTVTYTNGKETKRVVSSDSITKAPVNQVTLVGQYVAPEAPEKPSTDGFNENDRTTLQNIWKAVQSLLDMLRGIFK